MWRPILLAALLAAGCAARTPPAARPDAAGALPLVFACLQESGLALVSAHRGMADPTRAEHASTSLEESAALGPLLLEVDIMRTADGALVLHHDRDLDRTTTGTGPLARRTLAELRALSLRRPDGGVTDERMLTLDEVLLRGRQEGWMFQLDVKPGVSFAEVARAARAAGVAGRSILITYDLPRLAEAMAAAPDMMISASARDEVERAQVLQLAAGARPSRLLLFTGTQEPDAALLAGLRAAGVPAITGTLGRAGQRLDDRFMADGRGEGYARLAEAGVQLIASDRPRDAWAALRRDGRSGEACLGESAS